MNIFEKSYRTIKTRGITLTQAQMNSYRIKRVFNSVGDPEYLNADDAEQMLSNHIESGNYCLLEAAQKARLYIISIIVFEDIWSRNIFALLHFEHYSEFPDLITLYN